MSFCSLFVFNLNSSIYVSIKPLGKGTPLYLFIKPISLHCSVTVKATSLGDQSQATATAKDILDGATAWVNGVKITGTSTTNLSDKSAGNAAYTEVNDKLVINLKGDDAAAEDKFVNTGIKFVTQNEVPDKVYVTKVTTPDAEETAVATAV